jgi:threonine dehydrogenase-like Zn-dependent dehydrogenase
MKMKAAVFYGPGDIRVEEIERPSAGSKGMVLKVEACGICPLIDVPHYKISFPNVDVPPHYQATPPEGGPRVVLGHEFSGQVVEVGSEVTAAKVGDRLYGVAWAPCGICDACQAGDYESCPFIDGGGRVTNGAMAEYMLFPNETYRSVTEDKLIKLPDNVSYRDGALIEPVRLGVGMAKKATAGDVVVVFGQEIMGLSAVVHLKKIGAAKIIVADISGKRLQAAREVGADVVVDVLNDDIFQVVMRETSNKGADLVIEASCRPESLQQAVTVVRPFGQIWLGTFYTAGPFFDPSWQASRMVGMNLTQKPGISIHNTWGTLGSWMPLLEEAVNILQSGKITAEKYVTHYFPLNKVKEAFETAMNSWESIKVMIEP